MAALTVVIWILLVIWDKPADGFLAFVSVIANGLMAILIVKAIGLIYLLYLLSRR